MRWASASLLVAMNPPTVSLWPLMYLVVECTTTSMPSSSGRWKYGERKVLSQTETIFCAPAISATRARSTSFSVGLVGVSTQTILVFGVSAASRVPGFERSTKLNDRPSRLKTLSNRRNVPP